MKPFQFVTALSVKSAQDLVEDHGRYFAGGNDLLGEMKEYISSPRVLVNIKRLPGTDKIEPGNEKWTIGNNVTVAQIEDHPEIEKAFPALHQAAREVGSRQIRNVATVGGNLAQHSRCWYYRHRDVQCLKKGGDMCYARHGENKYHSLWSGNPCVSPVVSNLSVALGALGATVVVQRGDQKVRMSIPEFYAKAWDNPTAHNSLDRTDLIVQVEVPGHSRPSAYKQMSEKSAFDWALVSCAAAAEMEGGKVTNARIFLGAVSPVPYQAKAANSFLEGKTIDEGVAAKAADLLLQDVEPLEFNGYKVPIARALIQRTLLNLKA